MNTTIETLNPTAVWKNFKLICSVPHPSRHEEKIRELIVNFCKNIGLNPIVDSANNVIVSKPATPGMENRKGVILQAHLDMVPQANSDSKHNFETDPITAYVDGEWVRAQGTTLGADNGIGAAAAMAVLESKDIAHGPIEVLFTATEETGMDGANGLKSGVLKGDILMNMDSEDEGELYVGCAGGLDANISFSYHTEPVSGKAFQLAITGFKGGHSGMDIALGRANANKVMFRLLQSLESLDVRLSAVNGGSLRNAIPREAFATVIVPDNKVNEFKTMCDSFAKIVTFEFAATEPTSKFEVNETSATTALTLVDQKKLVDIIRALPNGVMRMSDAMQGLVETSTNLAIVKAENGEVKISCLLRSSVDSAKDSLGGMMVAICRLASATITLTGGYPGWKPNMNSPILKTMQSVYLDNWGKTPEIKAVHAGLECGILGAKYPHWDMISFGPTIRSPHSPDERVNIESITKFWEFLQLTLLAVPTK
ncbi:aminoacyl-histidine dipeptidase [Bacteroidia bacterium]|nr:aminoacyl-histidine dipeptidase [Bacteroidia bacterium]